MKRHGNDHQHGGPNGAGRVSAATREDLEIAVAALAESEANRAKAVAALARVRARGDGEAAVGMPVDQHLRWTTNLRAGSVSTLSIIVDVAGQLPAVMAAHAEGRINLDQLAAIAWPAAKTTADLRRSLDAALTAEDGWTSLSPDALEFEVGRLLEDITPAQTEAQELERSQRQFLHLQPTLDGQGLKGHFQAHGIDAALINATLDNAAERPERDDVDQDGVLVGKPTRRSHQLFDGLMRIFRGYIGRDTHDADAPAASVTLYAIVDETSRGNGAGEMVMTRRGLAPRLTAADVQGLVADGARRIEVFSRDGEIVAVAGRAGHTLDDPGALSDDTTRIIVTVRDRTCRMAGCNRPVEHLHHLIHRGRPGSTDDPSNLAGLCLQCHQHVVHRWRWAGTVGALGRITWHRAGTTITTTGRLAQRLPRPPPPTRLDPSGHPIPF